MNGRSHIESSWGHYMPGCTSVSTVINLYHVDGGTPKHVYDKGVWLHKRLSLLF